MDQSSDKSNDKKSLSPISRRAFFRQVAKYGITAAAVAAVSALMSGCGGGTNCGYCDGVGQDYTHCDGDYCDYLN